MRTVLSLMMMGLALLPAAAAAADPCRAITDEGWRPKGLEPGRQFSGTVVHVIDGDSLCVAIGPGQDSWVEVRLADFFAPEMRAGGAQAKGALERLAMGRRADCVAGSTSYDRIVAQCQVDGRRLGDSLRALGLKDGSSGMRHGRPSERLGDPFHREAQRPRALTTSGMSCAELRARGGARRGEPGYREQWDGDGDGIACEPLRRR